METSNPFPNGSGSHEALNPPVGRSLLKLWAAALRIEQSSIGGQDSFLRRGEHSIMAIQVATEARSQGINISVADILQLRDLGSLTAIVADRPGLSNTHKQRKQS